MYPIKRNRRLRTNESIRSLVRETILTPNDFLVPLFVVEGKGIKSEIPSMPNYFRYSLDTLEAEVKLLWSLGLKSVLVFVKVADSLKDNKGTRSPKLKRIDATGCENHQKHMSRNARDDRRRSGSVFNLWT